MEIIDLIGKVIVVSAGIVAMIWAMMATFTKRWDEAAAMLGWAILAQLLVHYA